MTQAQFRTDTRALARHERSRMLIAMRSLEGALAAASTTRERRWGNSVREALVELQNSLRVTRQSADAGDSLFAEIVQEYPRLQGRADQLRADYDNLQHLVENLARTINEDSPATIRDSLGTLLTKLRSVQARETELIFEAFQVDIGAGD
jgi:hypothetical protein